MSDQNKETVESGRGGPRSEHRIGRRVRVKARSYTTGEETTLDLSEYQYNDRFRKVPAWNIDSETAAFYSPNAESEARNERSE